MDIIHSNFQCAFKEATFFGIDSFFIQNVTLPFNGVEFDNINSSKEGCTISTYILIAKPKVLF